jgi:streptogrisin D
VQRRSYAVVAVVAAAMFLTVPSSAGASPDDDLLLERARRTGLADLAPKRLAPTPKVAPEIIALMTEQEKLDAVAERIEKAARDTPTSGLGGIVVDAKAKRLDLAWHGTVPAAIRREAADARRTGLDVRITAAEYTRSALLREADRIADQHMKTTDSVVRSVGPKADGSGLTVGVTPTLGRSLAESAPSVTSSVPLDFTATTPEKTDRYFDSYPYWGGSLLLNYASSSSHYEDYGALCTSGFGVTGLNGAATYIMFANHCGAGNWRTGFVGTSDGTIYQNQLGNTINARDALHDTQLILTSQGAGAGVYTGTSWLDSGQQGRSVKGSAANNVGDYVCTEGSFSGTLCNIRVAQVGMTVNITNYGRTEDMVRANTSNANRQAASGNGDSGGPVVSITTGGVLARGTISAMNADSFVPCPGVPGVPADQEGRHCSTEMFYPDIRVQLAGVGVRLNTQ